MGESRGGEGREAGGGPTSIILSTIKAYRDEGREPREIRLERVTEGLYSLVLWIHGESEPEEVLYLNEQEADIGATSTPFGGLGATGGDEG